MKRVFMVAALLAGFSSVSMAAPGIFDVPLYPCADPFSVTLTSYSWTLVPTSGCSGKVLMTLVNKTANTGDFVGMATTSSSVPTISTNTISIQIPKGTVDRGYPLDNATYLWMRTTHTDSETLTGQEWNTR